MGKVLKINLDSQNEIEQEGSKGNLPDTSKNSISVGKVRTNFFLPDIKLEAPIDTSQEIAPPIKKVVGKINKFIENIADDYFLLGLHLISLHALLKESKLTSDQIKFWYAENINMPYSSAMQCKKVAEVYSESPELIGRYTASGAYLLSSCTTAEEREEIWKKARGEKPTASVRDIRETLKLYRSKKLFYNNENEFKIDEKFDLDSKELALQFKIRKSLEKITVYSESFFSIQNSEYKEKTRKDLLDSVKIFLQYLEDLP